MARQFAVCGVIVPLLTPMIGDGGRVDEEALRAHVTWLIDRGVHGLMPCGTTGEAPLLATAERQRILEVAVEAAAHRAPTIAHVGAATTRETIELARHARSVGAEAVSVVTPYYFRLPDPALIEHYCRLAEAVPDTPVFLYNIPQCTGNTLSPALAEAIVRRCPNVVGIKDSAGNLEAIASFTRVNAGRFQVICGSDQLLARALEAGACGAVSGNANVFPELAVAIFAAFWRGDREGMYRAQERLDQARIAMSDKGYLALFKRCLELRGLRAGAMRPPLPEAPPEVVAECEARLRKLGFL